MTAVLLWILAAICLAVGIAGTVLPALPGPVLVFASLLFAAWADHFTRIGPPTLIALALLTVVAHVVDLAAAAIGVRRAGASGRAVAGAALGALAGLFFGLPGLVVGPFVGAVAAELTVRRDIHAAGRAGAAAWIGFLLGTAAKVAIVFVMIAIAAAAFVL